MKSISKPTKNALTAKLQVSAVGFLITSWILSVLLSAHYASDANHHKLCFVSAEFCTCPMSFFQFVPCLFYAFFSVNMQPLLLYFYHCTAKINRTVKNVSMLYDWLTIINAETKALLMILFKFSAAYDQPSQVV